MSGAYIDPSAVITGGSSIGKGAKVMAGVYLDGSIISEGAVISAGARLLKSFVSAGSIVPIDTELKDEYFANEGVARL